jgi:hypothetical protein
MRVLFILRSFVFVSGCGTMLPRASAGLTEQRAGAV